MKFTEYNDTFLDNLAEGISNECSFVYPISCNIKECVVCESLSQLLDYKNFLLLKERTKRKALKKKRIRERRLRYKLERYITYLVKEPEKEGLSTCEMRDALLSRVQKIIGEWDDNILHQVNADVFIKDILQRNNVLENNMATFVLRNENLSSAVAELKRDKEYLTREIFAHTIGFNVETTLEEMDEVLDALTWHCLQTRGDVAQLASHFELCNVDKGIDHELDDIVEAYRERKSYVSE